MNYEIKDIPSKDTISIRSKVLRPGQDISNCIYPHDDDESTFHLASIVDNKEACIVSFYMENNPELKGNDQYRFRGMATLEEFRKQGHASALLKHAFSLLKNKKIDQVWCNARINALDLYINLGMEICSEEFDIPGIGPHLLLKIDFNE